MEDLLSVIVPVYNSEEYIGSCVESVLEQSYSAFELILVEDGSTDNSLEICEALCRKDVRIRLMKQEHRGVSAARNLGIETAQGKYLFFLDSDDMIHPRLLESLYRLQEEKHAVIAAEGRHYAMDDADWRASAWKTDMKRTPKSIYMDNKKALKNINKSVLCGIGGKMILREAIDSFRFIEGLSHGEDTLFIYRLLAEGADLSVLCCNWYYYRRHGDNASRDLSPEACQERYRVERSICKQEIRNGRRENAVCRERDAVIMITEWYGKGRRYQDTKLMNYAKNLAERERRLKIFHELNWKIKLYFYLILYFYPLSRVALRVSINIPTAFRFFERQIS